MTNEKISISKNNVKMGGIPSISLPPIITCQNCEQCSKKCYALRMAKRRKSIMQAWARNLEIFNNNPNSFKIQLLSECMITSYFRYFVGGDIPNMAFFEMMVDVATVAKNCNFLAFTKNYKVVNDYLDNGGKIPHNLKIIFSEWDKPINNPHNLPKSKVIFKGQQEPQKAKICGGNCYECICKGVACWMLENGDTIHFYEH